MINKSEKFGLTDKPDRPLPKMIFLFLLLLLTLPLMIFGEIPDQDIENSAGRHVFQLKNRLVACSVMVDGNELTGDRLEALPGWVEKHGGIPFVLETDADFLLDLMWTGWRAPGKAGNAENPLHLNKAHFHFVREEIHEANGGGEELFLLFEAIDSSLEVKITYRLESGSFFVRRRVSVRDETNRGHFLRWIWPCMSVIESDVGVLKRGGFGQPAAVQIERGGAFFGLEYPASENHLISSPNGCLELICGQEMGQRISDSWTDSEWVVQALSPNPYVKLWFKSYLDKIRIARLRPFLLYNTWYDVRAPEYTERPEDVMNEKNLLRIIGDFKKELFEKRGLSLDMFVLDDGWDIYQSDWVLRQEEFPRGLSSVVSALKEMNTGLGIWFGPIGGYSHRDWRVDWMREQGYETIGDQLCLAGKRYKELFKRRSLDFIRNYDVGYFKWDGIQFSCSDPSHGHPVGIYSRRSVMESVIDLCRSARSENPAVFLNITSGTWLSPWWLKYADTIWMQGYDYGYSNVPSISRRDRAITYRDYVLYDDLRNNDFWFPIANLMTHGIIKGHLQKLGGEVEPIDKFTDNAVLYFARGVSMWELYVSPDLLTPDEWTAMTDSIRWAKDRFNILRTTEMIGGDPGNREAYGYLHLSEEHGVVAVRNPFIAESSVSFELAPSYGLDPGAKALVLERIYPNRWISPQLYQAGSRVEIPLSGYETAVYEIYPLEEADSPLLCGAVFENSSLDENRLGMKLLEISDDVFFLNPENVARISLAGKEIDPLEFKLPEGPASKPVKTASFDVMEGQDGLEVEIAFELDDGVKEATLALLLEREFKGSEGETLEASALLDGGAAEVDIEQEKGQWAWIKLQARPDQHNARIVLSTEENQMLWRGKISAWLVCHVCPQPVSFILEMKEPGGASRSLLPSPLPEGTLRVNHKIGEAFLLGNKD